MNDKLHRSAGTTAEGPFDLVVTPEPAGCGFSSLRVLTLKGGSHTLSTMDSEFLVLPLSGGCAVEVESETFALAGRADVFDGVTDFVYLPRDIEAKITGAGRFALPSAKTDKRLPARHGPADGVPVELRGAGNCSRQVHNYCLRNTFDADQLLVCEVLTPGGNWSSYPVRTGNCVTSCDLPTLMDQPAETITSTHLHSGRPRLEPRDDQVVVAPANDAVDAR